VRGGEQMIEVLEFGNNSLKKIICNECNSVLRFTKSDCTVTEYEGEYIYSQTCNLKCPVCGNNILVQNITNDFYGENYYKNYCIED